MYTPDEMEIIHQEVTRLQKEGYKPEPEMDSEERKKEEETANKELLIMLTLSAAIVTGGVYAAYLLGYSPTDLVFKIMEYSLVFVFLAAFLLAFVNVAPYSSSLFSGIVISLLFAVGVTMLVHSLSRREAAPTDEQRYECRITGGQLEHFGERGWVCIKPKP